MHFVGGSKKMRQTCRLDKSVIFSIMVLAFVRSGLIALRWSHRWGWVWRNAQVSTEQLDFGCWASDVRTSVLGDDSFVHSVVLCNLGKKSNVIQYRINGGLYHSLYLGWQKNLNAEGEQRFFSNLHLFSFIGAEIALVYCWFLNVLPFSFSFRFYLRVLCGVFWRVCLCFAVSCSPRLCRYPRPQILHIWDRGASG